MNSIRSRVGILDELTPEEMEESFQKSIAERKKTETVQSIRLHRFEKC